MCPFRGYLIISGHFLIVVLFTSKEACAELIASLYIRSMLLEAIRLIVGCFSGYTTRLLVLW